MVTRKKFRVSLLILTEDGASDSHHTISALVKKMLTLAVRGVQTHLVEFEPQNDRAAGAMKANYWKSKSKKDQQLKIDLCRTIATKLSEGDDALPGFVLFHFDGDRGWKNRTESENFEQFVFFRDRFIRPYVVGALAKKGKISELDRRMDRLRPLVPFYSIESWLYQNTIKAKSICKSKKCGKHLTLFDEWENNRELLDEILEPKEKTHTCLGSENNRSLAESAYPAGEVIKAKKSFEAAIQCLRDSQDLMDSLLATVFK